MRVALGSVWVGLGSVSGWFKGWFRVGLGLVWRSVVAGKAGALHERVIGGFRKDWTVSGKAVWLQAGWLFQEVVSGKAWWSQESLGWFQWVGGAAAPAMVLGSTRSPIRKGRAVLGRLGCFRKGCMVSGKG